ncbi:MAG: hypothetical protein N4A31_02560 [Rickettsiales bacterium]|jgi:hypothetical protein|nr:hypothetical protein [Rickettsiales bacterium]
MGKNLLKIITVIYSFAILFMYSSIANAADTANNIPKSNSNLIASYYDDDPEVNTSRPVINKNPGINKTTTKTTKKVTKSYSSKRKVKSGKRAKRNKKRTRKAMVSPFNKKVDNKKVNKHRKRGRKKSRNR